MRAIFIIAKRETRAFFDSLVAYILLAAFLGLSGFFTWIFGADVFYVGEASLNQFFAVAYWTVFFFVPALTMRSFAEERRSGTLELLLANPVNDWQIALGKFLSVLGLLAVAFALTLPYYVSVAALGPIDHGAVWSGYFGLLALSAAYIGLGLFASALTENQIVAFLLALFSGVLFFVLFDAVAASSTGALAETLTFLSLSARYDAIARGVVDSRDVLYLLSISFLGIFLAVAVLQKRNIVD
ncbi:MAG: ABC transporter permease subunit [Ignavibacteriales bacterium]|jgi:ABC-2 type transport system permease protein|nr:ABC transporter permease subunit [Ignavibacteriales bacterium]